MKTLTVAAFVLAAATFIAGGTALAADKKAPEPGSWEYQAALETGALPASMGEKAVQESARAKASVPTVEVAGVIYRVGIDTN